MRLKMEKENDKKIGEKETIKISEKVQILILLK